MLTDKSASGVPLYLLSGRTESGTESMSAQGRPEEGADCSPAVVDGSEVCCVLDGWVCLLCVCAVYMGPDCQTPYIETDREHNRVQEMTVIMPNVPFALVSLVVMDMVCNREEKGPHRGSSEIRPLLLHLLLNPQNWTLMYPLCLWFWFVSLSEALPTKHSQLG